MVAAVKITPDNRSTHLVRSTQPRSGTPDGNYYIDLPNDGIQLITAEELPNADFGSGSEANPLTNATKITGLALYFELLEQASTDTSVQNYLAQMDAVGNRMGKLVGAMAFLNGVKLDSSDGSMSDERLKLADTGFTEFAAAGGGNTLIDRIYHGIKASGIDNSIQPYFLLAESDSEAHRQAATPVDFSKTGDINEVVQTFGSTANGDTGAGTSDNLAYELIVCARGFGFAISEAKSSDSIDELGAVSQSYNLNPDAVSELSGIDPADVFGGAQVSPWTGAGFTRLTTPATETGFNEADGDFTDRITNSAGMTLLQARAYMDELMQQDTDQNANTGSTGVFRPKRAAPLYSINAQGKLVTRAGLFIEGIPAADLLDYIPTDDSGNQKTYPAPDAQFDLQIASVWFDDTEQQWFRLMLDDGAGGADFDTANAVTLNDSSSVAIAGDETDARLQASGDDYILRISFDHAGNTQGGLTAGEDKDVVFQIGSKNTKRKTVRFTITDSISQVYDARNEAETNG